VVVYPEGTWYVGVHPEDVAEIVEQHLVGGTPVTRLLAGSFERPVT
jgi:(2Fe-2S) ferredoxin